ncbi:MAG: DUF1592 domain-containing protein [Myxococcales bacterium]|nr:DUF1592 domain-containing protein [Myxococcales bacterium]
MNVLRALLESACVDAPAVRGSSAHAPTLRGAAAILCAAGLMATSACYEGAAAHDDDDDATSSTSVGDSGDDGGSGGSSTGDGGEPAAKPSSGPTGLRLLTPSQYQNSVLDVLGDVAAPALGQWRSSIAAAQGGLSSASVENYEEASIAVTEAIFGDEEVRFKLTGCTPDATPDDPCAAQVVADLGRRAWRRPLTADELARYTELAADVAGLLGGDAWRGLQHAVAGLLQSPNFLYRVEVGTPVDAADPTYVRLDSYELASRLSYLVWNTTPDPALLEAAERGDLDDPAGLTAEIERLLASPRARAGVVQLFVDMFDLDALYSLQKNQELLPAFTPTIGPAMRAEIERVIDDTVLVQRDVRRLFDTRGGFVDAELAALYGIEGEFDDSFAPVTLPETRGGLLTLAGFLAINSGEASTSPTRRGLTIREVLMCQLVPPPPPDVVPELPEPGEGGPMTKRELLEQHASDPSCASCHVFTDPIGLALEHYDALGGYRATDQGLPIDPSGELDGTPFADALELGTIFAEEPAVADCLVRNLYRYATGHIEQVEETAAILELRGEFVDSGYDLTAAVEALARSEEFRFATLAPEDAP